MWEDTKEYKQIMSCAQAWSELKERIHVKAIWIRGNGEYQEKVVCLSNWYIVEWLEDNLDAYWVADEAEMKITIECDTFYWKHPTIKADITVEEIEEQDAILESRMKPFRQRVMSLADIGRVYSYGRT